jgi:hypothetical protein
MVHREVAISFILHPSSFILHPSSFILHPSSFILHPSSFIFHPTINLQQTATAELLVELDLATSPAKSLAAIGATETSEYIQLPAKLLLGEAAETSNVI